MYHCIVEFRRPTLWLIVFLKFEKSTKKLLSEYLEYINEANGDDVIKYPGEARDIDLYSEDSLGSIPSCGEEEFEIEISDEPLPDSYWLMIGDRYFSPLWRHAYHSI